MGQGTQFHWVLTLVIIVDFGAQIGHGATKMDIHSMHIDTRVTSRFARTFITMEVQNPSNSSQEAIFDIDLPKTAFISYFSMTIDNVTTVATVSEKEEAKRTYQKAISRGQSAGLVQSTGRKMEHFKILVNVGPLAKATFKLTYEELLKRQLGSYELQIRVKPHGLVENFQINVDIIEPQGISFLKAVGTFMSNDLVDLVKVNRTERKAHIEFKPELSQQRTCPKCLDTYLDGDLVIKYDVKRDNSAGKLQVVNGYFVHYFAPPTLQRIPKNVVFVIDRSGSMAGNKIKQTYEAFLKILEDVPADDFFTILTFDDKVDKWRKQLVKAKPENIKKAKEFVSKITPRGGTDINKALLTAAKMLTNATFNNMLPDVSASIIIFLSDGDPTSGTTDRNKIINNMKQSLEGRASLYCLGFGNDVDYNFLEKLALQNGGLARRIYEDSDSALQLQGFYNEVAYPMLLDVQLQYSENSVEYLTQNSFRQFFQGSEIIVAGSITNSSQEVFTAEVTGRGVSEPFSVKLETNVKEEEEVEKEQQYIFRDFIERLWAYLTIEQLMTKQLLLEADEKKEVTQKALSLSLKYNFVTPLTSLVVTRPEEDDKNKQLVANKPKEDDVFPEEELDFMDNHYYVDYESAGSIDADLSVSAIDADLSVSEAFDHSFLLTVPSPTTDPTPEKCQTFHVLLTKPRICVQIAHDDDDCINLIHDASTGITLNARLAGDKSFARYGLLNIKLGVRVDIGADKVEVTHGSDVKTYNWNSSMELDGFLQKDGEKITVALIKDGVNLTILRVDRSFCLSLSVELQNLPKNHIGGLIGHFLNNNKTSFAEDDQIFPKSNTDCDFTPYGVEDRGSCLLTSLKTKDLTSGSSYTVPDIFTVP